MSREMPKIPEGVLTPEQIEKISGGDCGINDYVGIVDKLKGAYDGLVDFTSYVMERVAGP